MLTASQVAERFGVRNEKVIHWIITRAIKGTVNINSSEIPDDQVAVIRSFPRTQIGKPASPKVLRRCISCNIGLHSVDYALCLRCSGEVLPTKLP
jgi:hypothetical protein